MLPTYSSHEEEIPMRRISTSLALFTLLLVSTSLAVPTQAQVSLSTEVDSGYLLAAPNYLVTGKTVGQLNLFAPIIGGCYGDAWGSTVFLDPGFKQPGDEIDSKLGCDVAVSEHTTLKGSLAWYAIPGSRNDHYVAQLGLAHDFGDWTGHIGLEGHSVADGTRNLSLHIGADHSFVFLDHTWAHSPEVTFHDGGLKVFTDTLSVPIETAGVTWSPKVTVSVPSDGKSYVIVGVSFNLN